MLFLLLNASGVMVIMLGDIHGGNYSGILVQNVNRAYLTIKLACRL